MLKPTAKCLSAHISVEVHVPQRSPLSTTRTLCPCNSLWLRAPDSAASTTTAVKKRLCMSNSGPSASGWSSYSPRVPRGESSTEWRGKRGVVFPTDNTLHHRTNPMFTFLHQEPLHTGNQGRKAFTRWRLERRLRRV
ncbi:hypothetical protein EYF80_064263 [Liparis tanakae]|uniref:Uncharacterized protein n=1 Tax=Liparis tanakae TaxID=230148 RepID=A0A4Z2E9R8_9TELE|nr:hypothetical protein EYF80_064263 [Liparis tanakae]